MATGDSTTRSTAGTTPAAGYRCGCCGSLQLAVSWVLSSRIAEPIEALSAAATGIAAGDYTVGAPVAKVNDELAEVANAFNHMAAALAPAESTRRQLLSDCPTNYAHLATIQGYIEGLQDGVEEVSPAT